MVRIDMLKLESIDHVHTESRVPGLREKTKSIGDKTHTSSHPLLGDTLVLRSGRYSITE